MILTLTALVLFAAPLELAPAPTPLAALAAPLAQVRTQADVEETKGGLLKPGLLFGVARVLILLGMYAIHRLRAYLKEEDLL